MSFSRMARTLSGSLASTMSMMAILKKGSSCSLALPSRASRPFLRAVWAKSTSWSIYFIGSNFLALSMMPKCLGMADRVLAGKLATTMASVQPITMKILAASKKFHRFSGLTVNSGRFCATAFGPMLMPHTTPNRNTKIASTRPMI